MSPSLDPPAHPRLFRPLARFDPRFPPPLPLLLAPIVSAMRNQYDC